MTQESLQQGIDSYLIDFEDSELEFDFELASDEACAEHLRNLCTNRVNYYLDQNLIKEDEDCLTTFEMFTDSQEEIYSLREIVESFGLEFTVQEFTADPEDLEDETENLLIYCGLASAVLPFNQENIDRFLEGFFEAPREFLTAFTNFTCLPVSLLDIEQEEE